MMVELITNDVLWFVGGVTLLAFAVTAIIEVREMRREEKAEADRLCRLRKLMGERPKDYAED